MTNPAPSKPPRRWLLACGGCLGVIVLACCGVFGLGALLPSLRPSARDVYAAAPDLQAGQDVSNALIDSGVEGASVLVIPIKGSSGQIAIITLDESRGYKGFSSQGPDSLQTVVRNVVQANRAGSYQIERLAIDYRDTSGESSLSFTTTMEAAESYADGTISRQQFMGKVDFHLMDTLRYFGLDQALQEVQKP
jgi:hypothetical protein